MQIDIKKTRDIARDALNRTDSPETLAQLAEILGVRVAYLPESDRPNFGPNQVRFVCELVEGPTYRYVYTGNPDSWSFTVLEKPRLEKGSSWWIKTKVTETGLTRDISLQDANIYPYHNSDGRWGANHIAFTDESKHLQDRKYCCCRHCHHCPHGHSHGHHCR